MNTHRAVRVHHQRQRVAAVHAVCLIVRVRGVDVQGCKGVGVGGQTFRLLRTLRTPPLYFGTLAGRCCR